MGNGAKKFHEMLPKNKVTFIQKKIAKSVIVRKNNKQHIVGVGRYIFSWLVNLPASSRLVVNYEQAMDM